MSKVRAQKSPSPIKTVTIVILVTLSMTFIGAYATQKAISNRLQDLFNRQADQIANTYSNKLSTQITILEGIQGLWNSSHTMSEHGLSDYLAPLDLSSFDKSGVSSYFYIPQINKSNLDTFTAKIRTETNTPAIFKTFTVHPSSNQSTLYPVTYGYPVVGRESAIGLDFATFPERLDAINYARDTNNLGTTKAVTLQTTGKPGFFFILPLYTHDMPIDRTPARRSAFVGVVGAAFRSESAFEQIFGGADPYPYLDFQIYHGDSDTPDRLLYDYDPSFTASNPRFSATRKIRIHGQVWTLKVQSKPTFTMGEVTQKLPMIVTGIGLILTALLTLYALVNLSKLNRRF